MVKPIKVQTLDDILADMGQPVSAHISDTNTDKLFDNDKTTRHTDLSPLKKPTFKSPQNAPSAVDLLLKDNTQTVLDDKSLQLLSQVEIEKLQLPDKATRYARWLAFYYLSKKELSRHELRAKLIAKDCEPMMVDELLDEFAEKGYQSDTRCATMMVREAVRKGRGVRHITESLKKAGLDVKDFGGMNELVAMSDVDSMSDGAVLDDEINWLKLAVETRCKKYGNTLPKDPKDKARQLRFLQYRGFEMGVCFDALKMTLDDFDEH